MVAAVVLIGGFAAADAIRGLADDSEPAPPTTAAQTGPTRRPGPRPQEEAPAGWPAGVLQGSLVFTDAEDCRIRVIGLAGGTERPLPRFAGDCQLWAPPMGNRIAYGLGPSTADGFSPFKLADLAAPQRELGGYRALFGVVLWSPDGQRVAWCGRRRTGFDLEVGGAARRIVTCPVAYTPDSRLAWAIQGRLIVEGETVLRAGGGITYAHYGTDGSLAVVENGDRLVRYDASGELDDVVSIPQGRTPILSPRNCAAAFRPLEGEGPIRFAAFDCYRGRTPRLFGRDVAWSPDGTWLAVAQQSGIVFDRVVGFPLTLTWPANAARLAWRPR